MAFVTPPPTARAAERPNIVFILADDLGCMDLGVCGNPFYRTPNLDRLAREGMRFSDAYAASPVCSPTRASILTGRYPARLHLTNITQGLPQGNTPLRDAESLPALPLEETTLAEVLRANGYLCGCFGKWHLGADRAHWPDRRGFERADPGRDDEDDGDPGRHAAATAATDDPKQIQELTDRAEAFLAEAAAQGDRPFFLYLAHFAVHVPIQARPEITARYAAEWSAAEQRRRSPAYAAMVEELDAGVGRLLAQLESTAGRAGKRKTGPWRSRRDRRCPRRGGGRTHPPTARTRASSSRAAGCRGNPAGARRLQSGRPPGCPSGRAQRRPAR